VYVISIGGNRPVDAGGQVCASLHEIELGLKYNKLYRHNNIVGC